MNGSGEPDSDALLREAAGWFARMRGPDAEACRGDFEEWLSREGNRASYNRVAEVFAMAKVLVDDEPDRAPRTAPAPRPRRVYLAITGAALFAAATAGLTSWVHWENGEHRRGAVAAPIGTIAAGASPRSFDLADGSVVKLQPASAVSFDLRAADRRLTLERGGARFFVAHEQRPFRVSAGGGYVTARGTVFDVSFPAGQLVTVRLIQGIVEVRPAAAAGTAAAGGRATVLHAGQGISFAAAPRGIADRGGGNEANRYDAISVGELVRLANEHSRRPIRIADEATARLQVSGNFRIDDSELLANRLAALFNLRVDRSRPNEIVLRAK